MPTATLTEQLDKLEANLPAVPARILRLQRTLAGAAYDRTAAVVTAVAGSTKQLPRHRPGLRQDGHRPGPRRRRATC